jgi:hypothetical protein
VAGSPKKHLVYFIFYAIRLTGCRLHATSCSRLPQTIEPLISRTSTLCGSDPEPILHPQPLAVILGRADRSST